MKSLAVLFCVALITVSCYGAMIPDPYLQQYRTTFGKCLKADVSEDGGVAKLREMIGDLKSDHELGCLIACVMKEMKIMNNSEFVMDLFKKQIETVHADEPKAMEKLMKTADQCHQSTKNVTEECDMALAFTECYLKEYQ